MRRGHLIFTRNKGQAFMVGDDVTIRVVSIRGENVKLSIEAPREIAVDREEIRRRKEREIEGQENTTTS